MDDIEYYGSLLPVACTTLILLRIGEAMKQITESIPVSI
jgi:uncharacterized protein with HEPN domain